MQQIDFLIEKQNNAYLTSKNEFFSEYMKRIACPESRNILASFTGWNENSPTESLTRLLCPNSSTLQQGGYFLRYNGTGIAINPGKDFFERFTEAGFHLWEIDCVIVTDERESASSGVELIYALNSELNNTLLSYEQEPHIIRYLLHPKAYSQLASLLKPHYRQERETVIRLYTFDETEVVILGSDVQLLYRQTKQGNLLLTFKLADQTIGFAIRVEAEDCAFLSACDLLITSPESALEHNTLAPLQLVCLSEFSAKEGDIRLESAKRLSAKGMACLPFDNGSIVDLDTLGVHVGSTTSWHFVPHREITVVRLRDFAKLLYLGKDQIL